MVELTRGWNSRLGFSLQSRDNFTVISMVHPDSVAAKDGRLEQGDVLIMVCTVMKYILLLIGAYGVVHVKSKGSLLWVFEFSRRIFLKIFS